LHNLPSKEVVHTSPVSTQPTDLPLSGINILLVDDNEINLEVGKTLLDENGARVFTCPSGMEAITLLNYKPRSVDMILMDIQMPDMDGYSTTRQIRSNVNLSQIPIIAATAGATVVERTMALEAGMDGFVPKPYEEDLMIQTIVDLHSKRQLSSESADDRKISANY